MRALVTGGTGFIGSHVVRQLLTNKVPVRCLVRSTSDRSNLTGLDVEVVGGDLNDRPSLDLALKDCCFLFHIAADYRLWSPDPKEMIRSNIEGTRQIFLAAGQAGIERIVYTSSVAAIGRPVVNGSIFGIGTEDLDPPPDQLIGPYKYSKFMSDKLAREMAKQGLPIVIVNPAAPIGTQDIKPTPTGKMIVDFLNGKMPGFVDTGMNFIDVEDVAAGHWLALKNGRVGERYILGNRNLTLEEFLQKVAFIAGKPAPRLKIPYAVAWMAGAVCTGWANLTGRVPAIPLDGVRMAHAPMYYDAAKAVKELGLPQNSVETAIEKAVRWFRDNEYA